MAVFTVTKRDRVRMKAAVHFDPCLDEREISLFLGRKYDVLKVAIVERLFGFSEVIVRTGCSKED